MVDRTIIILGGILFFFLLWYLWTSTQAMSMAKAAMTPQPTVPPTPPRTLTTDLQVTPFRISTTTLNRPIASPYGVVTGNPLEDTPILWTENDVVGIFSRASKKYLGAFEWTKARKESLDQSGTIVLEATAPSAHDSLNAQWIIHQGLPEFPGSVKFENVLYRGTFLSVTPNTEGETIGAPGERPHWRWSLGHDGPDACVYSTLFAAVTPPSIDSTSTVIFSAPLAQKYTVLTRNSPVFLANDAEGDLIDENGPTVVDTDLKYERHNLGRYNFLTGEISWAGTSAGLQQRWQQRREQETDVAAEL